MNIGEAINDIISNPNNVYESELKGTIFILKIRYGNIYIYDKDNGRQCNIDYPDINRDWNKVQQAVDFMTAINSGKKIRSEFWNQNYRSIEDAIDNLASSNEEKIILKINGNWYIKE